MSDNPKRLEAIKRYREQALDRAAVIAALALARVEEYELGELADRQDAQLAELLHDFAFRLRKLAELAKREQFASVISLRWTPSYAFRIMTTLKA